MVSYLIKPFTFAGFRTKLEQYVRYREQMAASGTLGQSDVDSMLATLADAQLHGPAEGLDDEHADQSQRDGA